MIHFINCALLAFAPYYLFYRGSELASSRARPLVFRSAALAAVATGVKLLAMASLIPDDIELTEQQELIVHVLSSLFDLLCLRLCFSFLPGLGRFSSSGRALIVAIGWAGALSAATNLLPLWLGASGVEFSWNYLTIAIESNCMLFEYFSGASAAWLAGRTNTIKLNLTMALAAAYFIGGNVAIEYACRKYGLSISGGLFPSLDLALLRLFVSLAVGAAVNEALRARSAGKEATATASTKAKKKKQ